MQITMTMVKVVLLILAMKLIATLVNGDSDNFTYNGFRRSNMTLEGIAEIEPNGLLRLTNTSKRQIGHAFHSDPIKFKNSQQGDDVLSFSSTFIFAIIPMYGDLNGHGLAFTISPSKELDGALASQYLGLFNETSNGNRSSHVFAVELDTVVNVEFKDIDDNHVGIDINGLDSKQAKHSSYFSTITKAMQNLSIDSGEPIQVWIEYNGVEKVINVTLSPFKIPKPEKPLLNYHFDLSPIFLNSMYVGFSSSTGSLTSTHYIMGWSFKINGQAELLDYSLLPSLPRKGSRRIPTRFTVGFSVATFVLILAAISGTIYVVRKKRYEEIVEDWEVEYGPQRFSYKDLFTATKGFRDKELLGHGGFGSVYKGILPTSKIQVAVKRVSHDSRQGLREFVAEIASLGRLRHRNLVQLLGYCRRKGELLLVYDFMPNGSLDKFIFEEHRTVLDWGKRFRILRGVASGLLYLHEEWEQIVVHRDVKASNILLDGDLNGRLGDFGLARLYDHGTYPQTTHVVGTVGYLAPELTRTSRATTSSDVFAFGALLLEVACGRRPIEPRASTEEIVLVDWVYDCFKKGSIVECRDPKLGGEYVLEEMELVLKLGLLCSHPMSAGRPSMRQVMQFLDGDVPLPEISQDVLNGVGFATIRDDLAQSYDAASIEKTPTTTDSLRGTEVLLSGGR